MKLLKGRDLAQHIVEGIKKEIAAIPTKPGMGVILVGDDPSSHLYVGLKENTAREVGIQVEKRLLPAQATLEDVEAAIDAFNNNPDIQGILLQLPLPDHVDVQKALECIAPAKDVDGLLPQSGVVSPTVQAIMTLIKESGISLVGARAALLVNSDAFYRGIEQELAKEGIMLAEDTIDADIVIIAKGQPGFLQPAMIKKGAVVIDVGITVQQGIAVGDVAPEVAQVAGALTPVPGGVGPLTVAYLFKNLLELGKRDKSQET